MGKLTDSLKAATKQLDDIKHGIGQMTELGQDLVDNTLVVADKALRAGYAYAKAELQQDESSSQAALPATRTVLDAELLDGATEWTRKSLQKRFQTCLAAYNYLKNNYHVQLSKRSWEDVINAFNGDSADPSLGKKSTQRSLEQRVAQLEQITRLQEQKIAFLETRLNEMAEQLQQLQA